MDLLQEYAATAEADEDTDFVPGVGEGGSRQLSSGAAAQQRMRGSSLRGRLRHGKGRLVGVTSFVEPYNF